VRNVRPKKSHLEALEYALEVCGEQLERNRPGPACKNRDELAAHKRAEAHVLALFDLMDRVRQAAAPRPATPGHLSAQRFVDIATKLLPTYAPPVHPGEGWWARVNRQLSDAGVTEEDAYVVLSYTARWSRRPLTTETLLFKLPAWLAQATKDGWTYREGAVESADTSRPPAGLFDE